MELTNRQNLILERIIKEYIGSAEPVPSGSLSKAGDFKISPAMIRIEMEKLTEAGYLFQPFVSSGRVPTDKGYRFFVDKILKERASGKKRENKNEKKKKEIKKKLAEEKNDPFALSQKLTKALSGACSSMVFLSFLEDDLFFKDGWEELVREPEFGLRNVLIDFSDFIGEIEAGFDEIKARENIDVYIGKELPFPQAKDFSLIAKGIILPQNVKARISLIGPKRMDYDKNIDLIDSLNDLF